MPSFRSIVSVAALAAVAQAITITSPTSSTIWDSSVSNTITWTSVSTDPDTIDIYLAHMASQPTLNDLLFSSVDISKGSVDVSGLQLPTGTAYQINFVKPNSSDQIYAQSNQFNVTGTASSATSTLAGYTGPTYTPTASSTASTAVSVKSTETSSLTSSASSATGSATATTFLTTSTGSSTTSTGTVTSTGSASSGTVASASGTSTKSATSSSASATATGNAASGMAASAPLAALVFGAVAMFV